MIDKPVGSRLDQVKDGVLDHPFHRACEMALIFAEGGKAEVSFKVNDFTVNPQGALHGGIIYALIDVACFFAVVPVLAADQHPVSIETHVSILRAATLGETITIKAWTDRVGRTLAAMRAEVFASSGKLASSEEKPRLVATGNVTKSILQGRGH